MSKTTMIHARVEPELKQKVENIFSELGLSMTSAVNLFLKQVLLNKGLPFSVNLPNDETVSALKETLKGAGVKSKYQNNKEFFDDLLNDIED
jgi:DNA-damage-inducible protein J